jgi:hypothetical protein
MIKRVLFPPLDFVLESNFYLLYYSISYRSESVDFVLESNFYLLYYSISYRSESRFNRIQFNRNEDKTIRTESGRTLKGSSSKMFTMEKYSLWLF